MINIKPTLGKIKFRVLFVLLLPNLTSKKDKIDPANNSHALVGRK